MLKDRQKSAFDGFVDCIIIESCTIQLLTRRRSFGMGLFPDKRNSSGNLAIFTAIRRAWGGAS